MAEKLKNSPIDEKLAHIDSCRAWFIPKLVEAVMCDGKKNPIDVQLSLEETYAEIAPVISNEISAFISIMRGCSAISVWFPLQEKEVGLWLQFLKKLSF